MVVQNEAKALTCKNEDRFVRLSETPKYSVSVAGIVVDSAQRVLVIRRRDNGHWEIPGGVLELGEQLEDGVRREVAEEPGMAVEVDQLTGV